MTSRPYNIPHVSTREKKLLRRFAAGKTDSEIAKELGDIREPDCVAAATHSRKISNRHARAARIIRQQTGSICGRESPRRLDGITRWRKTELTKPGQWEAGRVYYFGASGIRQLHLRCIR